MTPEAKSRAELELIGRLREHGAAIRDAAMGVTEGITDANDRKARIRAAIRDNGLAGVIVRSSKGKPVTYADAFQWLFGEAL